MCVRGQPSTHSTNWRFERLHILPLALSQPCFVLGRPHPSLPLLDMRATTGRKGLMEREQGGVFDDQQGF